MMKATGFFRLGDRLVHPGETVEHLSNEQWTRLSRLGLLQSSHDAVAATMACLEDEPPEAEEQPEQKNESDAAEQDDGISPPTIDGTAAVVAKADTNSRKSKAKPGA